MRKTEPEGGVYKLFMLALCAYVLLALGADTLFDLDDATSTTLSWVDTGVCVVFLADFLVCLIRARSKLAYLKWGWIDLLASIPMLDYVRWGRVARIARIVRVLRGFRSTKQLIAYVLKRRGESAFAAAGLTSFFLIVFSSLAVLHVETTEGANITTPEEALWWSLTTITTVGYGDKYPVTTEGRILAGILMVAGVGLFGTFTAFVAAWFVNANAPSDDDDGALLHELRALRKLMAERGFVPPREDSGSARAPT